MAFFAAMDASAVASRCVGENNAAELTAAGVGDARVALFAGLTRHFPAAEVYERFAACWREAGALATVEARASAYADCALLAFQTRSCRGGKGERALFTPLAWALLSRAPRTFCEALLPLIPEYGYWKDLSLLYVNSETTDALAMPAAARAHAPRLRRAIVALLATQLRADERALLKESSASPSLLGKWAPREKGAFSSLSKALSVELYGAAPDGRKRYRQLVSRLGARLAVPEVRMCAHEWSEIDVSTVPSLCLARNRKGFLNEKLKRKGPLAREHEETGDRHPDDEDRAGCRKKIRAALLEKGASALKGKQLFPHELVRTVIKGRDLSTLEDDVINAQWAAVLQGLKDDLAKQRAARDDDGCDHKASCDDDDDDNEKTLATKKTKTKSVDLGNLVALVDVSASMSGTPMEVAIALGLIVSSVAAQPFKDRVLTFEARPQWFALDPHKAPTEQIRHLQTAPWGSNTDFAAAIDLILAACLEHKLRPDQIPNLIVFSDMQFDQADSGFANGACPRETHHERITRRFAEAGTRACGEPWQPPTITYWNLRGDTKGGLMAEHDAPGVRLLSGFSPSLLKLVLEGQAEAEDELVVVNADGTTTIAKSKPTPYSTLRKALDDPHLDKVRAALAGSTEPPFDAFDFTPPAGQAEDADWVDVPSEAKAGS